MSIDDNMLAQEMWKIGCVLPPRPLPVSQVQGCFQDMGDEGQYRTWCRRCGL